ncbi:MAG: penicillin acylase family protein [Leptospiraceae bacterium]|nr:penicillin acylase family protein [Leptospiraceae bacterium]
MLQQRLWKITYISIAAIIGILIALYGFLTFRLPSYNGRFESDKLLQPVDVYRDSYGMPHIHAANEHDAYLALGYVMAQDRMFQMDLFRRAANGRLSEVLGESTVRTDMLFRAITAPRPPDDIYSSQPAEIKAALIAFSEGVNLALERESKPIEFLLLGYDPEPWKPQDSLAALYLMSWDLSPAFSHEVLYSLLKEKLGPRELAELFPEYVSGAPDILTGSTASLDGLKSAYEAHRTMEALFGTEDAGASNNWVVGPGRSATDGPVVANDMHLGHGLPGIWYQAHIICPGLNVTGFLLPGVPFVVVGGNETTARGFTNVMLDDMDFYRERLDDTGKKVLYRNRYVDLVEIPQKIEVKGQEAIDYVVKLTPHGPIINSLHPMLRGDKPVASELLREKEAISIRWTLYDNINAAVALYRANRAQDIDDIEKAIDDFKIPAQNWVYADAKGNIGYTAAAGIPVRPGFSGMEILRGWDGTQEWAGYVPTSRQPHLRNPASQWIASANNRHGNLPYSISHYYAAPDRYERIRELIESTDVLDIKDHQRLQADVYCAQARRTMPRIRLALRTPLDSVGNASMDRAIEKARNTLLDWNLQTDVHSSGSTVYHFLMVAMIQNLYEPRLGSELFSYYVSNRYTLLNSFVTILGRAYHPFYGENGKEGSRNEFVRRSFVAAVRRLTEVAGSGPSSWDWGSRHGLKLYHPFGRQSAFLGYFFNRGPFAIAGGWTTVAPAGFAVRPLDKTDYLEVTHGASERMIYDVLHPDQSLVAIPAGISGRFMSPHYDDQIDNYLKVRYRPSYLSLAKVKEHALYRMQLLPAKIDSE